MSHSEDPKTSAELRLFTVKDLQVIFRLSRSSIYRLIQRDEFPKPVVIGPADKKSSSIRWREDEINAFIDNLPRGKVLED